MPLFKIGGTLSNVKVVTNNIVETNIESTDIAKKKSNVLEIIINKIFFFHPNNKKQKLTILRLLEKNLKFSR